MIPVLTLPAQPWMQDTALAKVMGALGDGDALIVGGAVRAAILGEAAGDIDIATKHAPAEAVRRLEAAGLKVVPTGIDHGTVTAVCEGRGFEVTTLRRDVETDGRRAVVAFTDDWAEDAQRRDFTMNTLLMNMAGAVFDPTGNGVADLKAGRVRFVGDADTRIAEDALRILRFFRFFARYGRGQPDAEGLAASIRGRDLIENLSRERITHELERIFPAVMAGAALEAMIQGKILPNLLQKNFNYKMYNLLQVIQAKYAETINLNTLFAYSVWENKGENLELKCQRYLALSNAKKAWLKNCIKFVYEHTDSINNNLYNFGQSVTLSGSLLFNVINAKEVSAGQLEAMVQNIAQIPVPVFPVKAGDVMKVFGLKEGKPVGDLLKRIEGWWLENDTTPDRESCLAYARTLL